jgi:hypothetical protein
VRAVSSSSRADLSSTDTRAFGARRPLDADGYAYLWRAPYL